MFDLDVLGDHVSTCTVHSGAKKTHDWTVEEIADLFRSTHKKRLNRWLRIWVSDVETSSLPPTWLTLRHRFPWFSTCTWHTELGKTGNYTTLLLFRPADIDRTLNETAADKIRDYRVDCNNRPSNATPFMTAVATSLSTFTVNLCAFYFYRLIGKPTVLLLVQEFNLHDPSSSTTVLQRSTPSSNRKSVTSSPRLQYWVSI